MQVRYLMRILAGWHVTSALLAAIPGTAEPPVAETPARLTLTWHNDVFGGEIGDNADDFRTNGFGISWLPTPDWIASLDYSNLTDRGGLGGQGDRRVDELSVSISRRWLDLQPGDMRVWLASGLGVRHFGDLGGDDLQNNWHDIFTFLAVPSPYEESSTHPLLSTAWHAQAAFGIPWPDEDMVLARGSRLLIANTGSVAATDTDWQFDSSTRLVMASADSRLWTGLRFGLRGGTEPSPTAQVVAEQEEGSWLLAGASIGAIFLEASYNLSTELSRGWLGWRFDYERRPEWFGGDRLVAEIGPVIGDFALDFSLRWQPKWLQLGGPIRRRSQLWTSYAWGHVPGADFRFVDSETLEASIRYQQFTVGWDLSLFDIIVEPEPQWLDWTPFCSLGAGWRREAITPERRGSYIPREREDTMVIEAGVGARLYLTPRPEKDGVRYGFSTSYLHRFILDEAHLTDRIGNRYEYLQDNGDLHLRLLAEVGW